MIFVDEERLRYLLRDLLYYTAYDHILEKYDVDVEFIDPLIEKCKKSS